MNPEKPASDHSAAISWLAGVLRGETRDNNDLSERDWETLVDVAITNGVAPLVHSILSQGTLWGDFPETFCERLAKETRQAIALEMLRQDDLGKLLDDFAENDIEYLLIKGGGLAYTHYDQSWHRDRCDSDILFPDQASFDRAWNLLAGLGYSRRNTLSGEFVGFQHSCHRELAAGNVQALDCHTRINDYAFYANAFSFDELAENSVPVSTLAESAGTLGTVHALILACMHYVTNIPHGSADRLIWLYDMVLLGRSLEDRDWSRLIALASEKQLCGTCVSGLAAASRHFPGIVPSQVLKRLDDRSEQESFQPGEEMKRWQYYRHALKSVPGVKGKARMLREHFFPSANYMKEKYRTDNMLLLPFLYIHRVFSGMRRYF